jgi:hypothetical protein
MMEAGFHHNFLKNAVKMKIEREKYSSRIPGILRGTFCATSPEREGGISGKT